MLSKLRSAVSLLKNHRYIEDGMGTSHVADFLRDPGFVSAYRKGVETGSWHGQEVRWRTYNACWAAQHALSLHGDFVECGVNRGGTSRAVVEFVDFGTLTDRRFFLLDTYRGSESIAAVNRNEYQECYQDVVKTFSPFANVKIIRGPVPDTLSQVDSEQICYLALDMNSAAPEIAALRCFWSKLVKGAIVLLDDYSYSESYRPQKEAFDAMGREFGFSVLTMPTGQGMIVKS
jgi:O-methyltransferase